MLAPIGKEKQPDEKPVLLAFCGPREKLLGSTESKRALAIPFLDDLEEPLKLKSSLA